MRIAIRAPSDVAPSSIPTANFGEPFKSYATPGLERAVEANLRTVPRQSFSHKRPTVRGHSLPCNGPGYER
jgi:hypothetical protein